LFSDTGVVLEINQSLADILGLTREEVLGEDIRTERLEKYICGKEPKIEKAIQSGETQEYDDIIGNRHFHTLFIPIGQMGGQRNVLMISRDITDRKQLEEMMIQSEKMLSIGGLAAGMAHEINNPLAGMMQNAQVVLKRLGSAMEANDQAAKEAGITMEQIREFMEKRNIFRMLSHIEASGKRASLIVKDMLSFARKADSAMSSCDMAELLDKTVDLAQKDYNLKKNYDFKRIEIVREYEPNLPLVPCDSGKIQLVLLNILKNGAEAMIEASNGVSKSEKIIPQFILRVMKETDMLCIEIEDNGPGIDKEIQKNIFEPFFTTKPLGKGTGLGLSVSFFIITQTHKGTMEFEATDEQGSKFVIKLPLTQVSPYV